MFSSTDLVCAIVFVPSSELQCSEETQRVLKEEPTFQLFSCSPWCGGEATFILLLLRKKKKKYWQLTKEGTLVDSRWSKLATKSWCPFSVKVPGAVPHRKLGKCPPSPARTESVFYAASWFRAWNAVFSPIFEKFVGFFFLFMYFSFAILSRNSTTRTKTTAGGERERTPKSKIAQESEREGEKFVFFWQAALPLLVVCCWCWVGWFVEVVEEGGLAKKWGEKSSVVRVRGWFDKSWKTW